MFWFVFGVTRDSTNNKHALPGVQVLQIDFQFEYQYRTCELCVCMREEESSSECSNDYACFFEVLGSNFGPEIGRPDKILLV
jgi:hypothetical protein